MKFVEGVKAKYPTIGYADLIQMFSAAAIEATGGPKIPMRYGRIDAKDDSAVPADGRLPAGNAPFHEAKGKDAHLPAKDPKSPEGHLRRVFGRMGLNDQVRAVP